MPNQGYNLVFSCGDTSGTELSFTYEVSTLVPDGWNDVSVTGFIEKTAASGVIFSISGIDEMYTIVSGDTLWGIAQSHYGNGARWTEIYEANKDVIEARARQEGKTNSGQGGTSLGQWIYPGTVLIIPD